MPQFRQRRRTGWRYTLLALITIVCTTCIDSPFEPGQTVTASLDIAALLSAAQSSPIPIEAFAVELRRSSDSSVVVNDTIFADSIGVAADADSVVLDVLVPLESDPEQFYVSVSVIGGGVEWFVVVGVVTASTRDPVVGEVLVAVYVGPGWDATSLTLTPSDTTITGGDSVLVTGTVYRDQTVIDGAPVSFASSDESLVPEPRQVGLNQAWLFAPAALTDSVTVSGTAPTAQDPLADSAILSFFARPDQLEIVSGNNQNMNPGEQAAEPLVVQVLDAAGDPFARGYDVVFAVASGPTGTSVSADTVPTDAQGLAQTDLTAGDAPGAIQVTAEAQGLAGSPVTFSASVADVTGPATIMKVAGDNQSAIVATAVATAPSVMVLDAVGGPVASEQVVFAVTGGGGSLTAETTTTDPSGIATVGSWTLGQTIGTNTITATVTGLQPVTFTATGTADVPDAIFIVSGNNQTADGGTALPAPLVVEVQDQYANPAYDVNVVWTALDGSMAFGSGETDAAGRAQNTWTLGTGGQTQTATAAVSGLQPVTFTATATFSNPTILLALVGADRIAIGGSATLEVILSEPAAGDVDVLITSDNTAIADVQSPGSVLITSGGTSGQIGLDGVSAGTTTIRGSATGWTEGTTSVEVSPLVLSLPSTLNVPFGGTASVPVQISTPAPAGGEVVTLVSSDPGIVGVVTPTVTIPEGLQTANGTLSGVLPGTVTLTGTSGTYGTAQSTVSTTANLNIVQNSATLNASFGTDIQVQLESAGSPIAAPAGGIAVTLTPADPTCLAVTSPMTIPAGLVDVTASLSYGGGATLQCVTTLTATATSIAPDNITVTVNPAPGITVSNTVNVGSGLLRFQSGFLGASNHGGVTLTITSSDQNVMLLSPDAVTVGAQSIDIFMPNGTSSFSYYTHGIEGQTGTVTITASATGFTDGTNTVGVVQPAFDITGLVATTTTLSPNDPFQVRVGVPNAAQTFLNYEQAVRPGGQTITVDIDNSDAAVAQFNTSTVTGVQTAQVQIVPGVARSPSTAAAGGIELEQVGAGTTDVSAAITGFVALPAASQSVTISAPAITVSNTVDVGSGLLRFQSGFLGASSHGGVTVTLTSSDQNVMLLSPDAVTVGAQSIDISMPNGTSSFSYYTHGIEGQTGTVTITASATGFTDGTNTVDVVQPAFDITGLVTTTTTLSPNDAFQVRVGVPNAAQTFLNYEQPVRPGGQTITVDIDNRDAAVAQFNTSTVTGVQTAQVQIVPGVARSPSTAAAGGIELEQVGAGTTDVSAAITGFVALPAASQSVTISAPAITVSNTVDVGSGLLRFQSGFLGASSHGGVTVTLTSSDQNVMLLSPDAVTVGGQSIDIFLADGATSFSYYTHGLEGQTGTVTITASATGFTDGTNTVDVVQPAFDITGLVTTTTTLSPNDPFQVRVGVPNAAQTFMNYEQVVRPGGQTLTINLDNSQAAFAQLRTNAVTGQSVQVQILPGSARSPSTVASDGVEFEQLGAGTTTVSASLTGFVALPNASQAVSISAPAITVSNTTDVGSGLIRFQSGFLGASSHGGVTVTVTSSDQNTLLLSPDAVTVGAPSIDIFIPDGSTSFSYYTHGLEGQTGNVSVTANADGFVDGSNAAAVVQPAFDIISLSASTTAGAADDPFQVRVGIPNAAQTFMNYEQPVRPGGQTLSVTVDNSNAVVGQLALDGVPPAQSVLVQIVPGAARSPSTVATGGVAFDPVATGTTTVAATITGFIVLPTSARLVTVNP